MLHKTVEAKATATELGEFTALAAAYTVDRGNERIIPGAFSASIERWQTSGKSIPLHWDHSGDPHDIIGTVDPHATKETDAGLVVAGKLDLENSEVAQEAWRTMKSGAMGLSFGYMVLDGAEADDGVYELKAVDVFEISITSANSARPRTRLSKRRPRRRRLWTSPARTTAPAPTTRTPTLPSCTRPSSN
jgi:HK97 family phage prohead protease